MTSRGLVNPRSDNNPGAVARTAALTDEAIMHKRFCFPWNSRVLLLLLIAWLRMKGLGKREEGGSVELSLWR